MSVEEQLDQKLQDTICEYLKNLEKIYGDEIDIFEFLKEKVENIIDKSVVDCN